jgi:hypothetical protein
MRIGMFFGIESIAFTTIYNKVRRGSVKQNQDGK